MAGKREWTETVVPAFTVTALVLLLEYSGWLASPIGKVSDLIWGRASPAVRSALPPLVTVEIDRQAFHECFGERQPLDANRIESMVRGLAGLRPAVVGVDIITGGNWSPGERDVPEPADLSGVVWMASGKVVGESSGFLSWLAGGEDEFVVTPDLVLGTPPGDLPPGVQWAVPFYPLSDDRKVRLVHDTIPIQFRDESPHQRPGFAAAVAGARARNEGGAYYIAFGPPGPERFTMTELFDCRSGVLLPSQSARQREFYGQIGPSTIVLLGGTFEESGDAERETPIGLLPGLLVNAYAIQTLIGGSPVSEENHLCAALIDLATGLAFGWTFSLFRNRRWNPTRGALVLGAAVAVVLIVLLGPKYAPGAGGVLFGMMLHHIWEGWRHAEAHDEPHKIRRGKPRLRFPYSPR
jgi:hypothetical protein